MVRRTRFMPLVFLALIHSSWCLHNLSQAQTNPLDRPIRSVRSVEVPADRLPALVPPGTPVRIMPLTEFNSLIRQLNNSKEPRSLPSQPRILRIWHHATLSGNELEGRTELLLEATANDALIPLAPWSPAVQSPGSGEAAVLSSATDPSVLAVQQGPEQKIKFRWRAHGLRVGDQVWFDLELPDCPVSSLSLEAPDSVQPEIEDHPLVGPLRAQLSNMQAWRVESASGRLRLRVSPTDPLHSIARTPVPTLSGQTSIIHATNQRSWAAEWTLKAPHRSGFDLRFEIDPRIDIDQVLGPSVEEYRLESTDAGMAQLVITVGPLENDQDTIIIRGTHHSSFEGTWEIPTLRPLDAIWIGGTYLVEVDPSLRVESVLEKNAFRVPTTASEGPVQATSDGRTRLKFESTGAGTPAALMLEPRTADPSGKLIGAIKLDSDEVRFEGRLTWLTPPHRGDPISLVIDPGWTIDHFQILALDEPTTWSVRGTRANGSQEINAVVPASVPSKTSMTAVVRGRGTTVNRMELRPPRIQATGVNWDTESWCMIAAPPLAIRPTRVEGATWIDPVADFRDLASFLQGWPEPVPKLAWRFSNAEQIPTFQVANRSEQTCMNAWVVVDHEPDGPRVQWYLQVTGTQGSEHIDFSSNLPVSGNLTAQLITPHDQRSIPVTRLNGGNQPKNSPSSPFRWRMDVPLEFQGESQFLASISLPLSMKAGEAIPLPSLDPDAWGERYILLHTDTSHQLQTKYTGLQSVDPQSIALELDRVFQRQGKPSWLERGRLNPQNAFRIIDAKPSLEMQIQPLGRAGVAGLIEEAELVETTRPDGRIEAQIALLCRTDHATPLEIEIGRDANLTDFVVDDVRYTPQLNHGRIQATLPKTGRLADGLSSLKIRYSRPARPPVEAQDWKSAWPGFSLPCLTMRWWPSSGPGGISEQFQQMTRAARRLSTFSDRSLNDRGPDEGQTRPRTLLETRLRQNHASNDSLGDTLLRLDSLETPIVVDTTAMRLLGLRYTSKPPSAAQPEAPPALSDWLQSWGLAAVVTPRGTLLTDPTTASSCESDRVSLDANLREAIQRGYSPRLRWVSATSWISYGNGPPIVAEQNLQPVEVGLDSLVRLGPGTSTSEITTAPPFYAFAVSSCIGITIAAMWWPFGFTRAGRFILCSVAIAFLIWFFIWPTLHGVTLYVRQGVTLGIGLCGLALLLFPSRCQARNETVEIRGPLAPGSRNAIVPAVIIATSAALLAPWNLLASDRAGEEITVFLPYEIKDGQIHAPQRAVILLQDFETIQEYLASVASRPSGNRSARVKWARHEVESTSAGQILVTSRYDLSPGTSQAGEILIPFGEATTLRAKINGQDVPIRVDGEHHEARISIPPNAEHAQVSLLFDRDANDPSLEVPLLPVASSDVILKSNSLRVDINGIMNEIAASVPAIPLGPVRSIEIHPCAFAGAKNRQDQFRVTRFLWDIDPAGDTLQIQMQPGSTPHGPDAAIEIDGDWSVVGLEGEEPDRVEQLLAISPTRAGESHIQFIHGSPLPRQITLWRNGNLSAPNGQERSPPRIRLLGGENSQPTSAYRLAPELSQWAGPEMPPEGASTLFLANWESLWNPDRPLREIAGGYPTVFGQVSWPTHSALGRKVSVTTALQMQPDRLSVQFQAILNSKEEPLDRVLLQLPSNFHLDRVDGAELSDSFTNTLNQLVLCFEEKDHHTTSVRMDGWVPLAIDPRAAATQPRRMEIPRLTWLNATNEQGILTLETVPEILVEPEKNPGVVPDTSVLTGGLTGPRSRYRIEPDAPPMFLSWSLLGRPSRVSVASHLVIFPQSTQWQAEIRYVIDHGPLHQLIVEIPEAWSERAEFRVLGSRSVVRKFRQNDRTRVEIQLLEPCWGEAQLSLRSELEQTPLPLVFPDITPLGLGTVDTYFAWSNLTGTDLVAEGSSGIQPVEAQRFQERAPILGNQIHTHAYHVLRSGWSLRVRKPLDDLAKGRSDSWITHIEAALSDEGGAFGTTLVESRESGHQNLSFHVPNGTQFLGATVNGQWTSSAWLAGDLVVVPIGNSSRVEVRAYWFSPPFNSSSSGSTQILMVLPAIDQLPFSARLFTPDQYVLNALRGNTNQASPLEFFSHGLQSRVNQIQRTASTLDRSNLDAKELFLADLINYELEFRQAARQLETSTPPTVNRDQANSQAIRTSSKDLQNWNTELEETLVTYGLDSLLAEARRQVGTEQTDDRPDLKSTAVRKLPGSRIPMLASQPSEIFLLGHADDTREAGVRLSADRLSNQTVSLADSRSWLQIVLPLAIIVLCMFTPRLPSPRFLSALSLILAWWVS